MKKTRQNSESTQVTAELIALYKRRASRLRAEACRSTWRSLWASLARIKRRH